MFKTNGGDNVDKDKHCVGLRSTSFAACVQNKPIDLLQPRTLGTEAGSSIWEGWKRQIFGEWGELLKIKDLFVSVDASVMIII